MNTVYKGFNKDDPVKNFKIKIQIIENFWNILSNFNQEDLGVLLQFCTGSSRVPIEGFR